jgi:hypothetical protein
MLREQEKNVRGEIRSIRYFRPHVKHYFVDEIDEAYKNFLAKRALRKSSIGVAVMDGRTIMTAGAIYREHGLSEQIIEKARDKGWLEAVRMRRRGSGRHDAAWWYFRKFAIVTGSGEWSGVTLLRRERGKLRTQYRVDRKH